MYVPTHFQECDQGRQFDFIEQNSFGLLASQLNGEPFATHLPFLLDRQSGNSGMLIGHMAKANPHWQTTDNSVLVVFAGPHVYISPTWYKSEDVVPTWNYVAVHVYGKFKLVASHEETIQIVRDYVEFYERSMPNPWQIERGDDFVDKMAHAVVAFRIEITRLEGKWKLNQNHPRERRENVIAELELRPDDNSQGIAHLMARTLRAESA